MENDIDVFDRGYVVEPMINQLHKLLDSEGNKVEIKTVQTDDGIAVVMPFSTARKLLTIANAISVKHRKQFFDDIQTSEGLLETMQHIDHLIAQAKSIPPDEDESCFIGFGNGERTYYI